MVLVPLKRSRRELAFQEVGEVERELGGRKGKEREEAGDGEKDGD